MTDQERLKQLRTVLDERRRDAFAPGFADRVVARWRKEVATHALDASASISRAFGRWFTRLVPLAAAAAVLLAVYNVRHRTAGQTALAAILGGPVIAQRAVSAAHLAPLDDLYGLGSLGGTGQE